MITSRCDTIVVAALRMNEACRVFRDRFDESGVATGHDQLDTGLHPQLMQALDNLNNTAIHMVSTVLAYPIDLARKRKWVQLSASTRDSVSRRAKRISDLREVLKRIDLICSEQYVVTRGIVDDGLPREYNNETPYQRLFRLGIRMQCFKEHADHLVSIPMESQQTEHLSTKPPSVGNSFNLLDYLAPGDYIGQESCAPRLRFKNCLPATREDQITAAVGFLNQLTGRRINLSAHIKRWIAKIKGEDFLLDETEELHLVDTVRTDLLNCLSPWMQYPADACIESGSAEEVMDVVSQDIKCCLKENQRSLESLSFKIQTIVVEHLEKFESNKTIPAFPKEAWKELDLYFKNRLPIELQEIIFWNRPNLPVISTNAPEGSVLPAIMEDFNTMIRYRNEQRLGFNQLLHPVPHPDAMSPSSTGIQSEILPEHNRPEIQGIEQDSNLPPLQSGGLVEYAALRGPLSQTTERASIGPAVGGGLLLVAFAGAAFFAWCKKKVGPAEVQAELERQEIKNSNQAKTFSSRSRP